MRFASSLMTLFALTLSCATFSCASTADNLCAMQCDCEHCNDYAEDTVCILAQLQQDTAENYGCDAAYDAWAVCVEEKGICDEKEARFSTRETSTCSGSQMTGQTCMNNGDCNGFAATCVGGNCVVSTCSGSNDPCQDNFDCQGNDLCNEASQALNECVANASDKPSGFFDFNFN